MLIFTYPAQEINCLNLITMEDGTVAPLLETINRKKKKKIENTQQTKLEQMRPMWLCNCSSKQFAETYFEETFENGLQGKIEQI